MDSNQANAIMPPFFELVGGGPVSLSPADLVVFRRGLPDAFLAADFLRYLSELRSLYPDVLPSVDNQAEVAESVLQRSLALGRLRLVVSWPFLSASEFRTIDAELATLMSLLVCWHPSFEDSHGSEREKIRKAVSEFRAQASEETQAIGRIILSASLASIFPSTEHHPDFGNPQRVLLLLERYWEIVTRFVSIDSEAWVIHAPHPLVPLLVSLRARVKECFRRLDETETSLRNDVDFLFSWTLEDDGDWGILPDEYVPTIKKRVQLYIEETRQRRRLFDCAEITKCESLFISTARSALNDHEAEVRARRRKIEAYADELRKKNEADHNKGKPETAHESGSPTLAPTPADPRQSPRLSKQQQKALEFIKRNPRATGFRVARAIGVKESTFLSHYVQALRVFGVVNDNPGYRYDPEKDRSRPPKLA